MDAGHEGGRPVNGLCGLAPSSSALLLGGALVAGFLDALAGGGSLVMLPALDEALPASTPAPSVLGTNKLVDLSGNLVAIRAYIRGGSLRLRDAGRFALAGAAGGLMGARLALLIQARWLPWMLLAVLPPMLVLTLLQPRRAAAAAGPPPRAAWPALAIAGGLGVYDGFLGAGTGALLVFALVQLGRHDHLQAVAAAKAIHGGSNLAALAFFIAAGRWIPCLALTLAGANILGSFAGARLALRLGAGWVRGAFILAVGGLALKLCLGLLGM
jgi:uncharacterized membrane protein YfcA